MERREAKGVARRLALFKRDGLEPGFRSTASAELATHIDELPIPAGILIAGYVAIRSEIDPLPLLMALRERSHTFALPVVLADRETMIFRAWDGSGDLTKSSFGLSVPQLSEPEVTPSVLLVPLAAFDRRGYRIGYGKGHYDRALARLEAEGPVVKIGVAFSCQEIAEVPAETHDRRLDFMLTETEIFVCKDN